MHRISGTGRRHYLLRGMDEIGEEVVDADEPWSPVSGALDMSLILAPLDEEDDVNHTFLPIKTSTIQLLYQLIQCSKVNRAFADPANMMNHPRYKDGVTWTRRIMLLSWTTCTVLFFHS